MQAAIYQLTLVIGLSTLAILLVRGVSLQVALVRSGMVLVVVLILLIIAGSILRLSMRPREPEEGQTEGLQEGSLEEQEGEPPAGKIEASAMENEGESG